MLPVTSGLVTRLDADAIGDDRIPAAWKLRRHVAALARQMSADRTVLYIFSETAAGARTKEAIAWHEGRLLYSPSGTCDIEADFEPGYHLAPFDSAVNAGLRAIGVRTSEGHDDYENIGLTRHRMTDDWLQA
jgi:hypothetical protein